MRKKGIQILDSTFGILLYAPLITVCHGPCVWFCAFLNFRYFIKKKVKRICTKWNTKCGPDYLYSLKKKKIQVYYYVGGWNLLVRWLIFIAKLGR